MGTDIAGIIPMECANLIQVDNGHGDTG